MGSFRNSNIELLRILAVFFVVVHHIILHFVMHDFAPDYNEVWLNATLPNRIVSSIMYSGGG